MPVTRRVTKPSEMFASPPTTGRTTSGGTSTPIARTTLKRTVNITQPLKKAVNDNPESLSWSNPLGSDTFTSGGLTSAGSGSGAVRGISIFDIMVIVLTGTVGYLLLKKR